MIPNGLVPCVSSLHVPDHRFLYSSLLRRNVFTFEDVDMVEKYTDVPPANSDHNAVLDYYHAVEVLATDRIFASSSTMSST
mgnify:CR=1 FL=1